MSSPSQGIADITAPAQISCSGRQTEHPVQDSEPGSAQARSLFPHLNQQGADIFSWKCPVIAAAVSGTFGGRIPREEMRMLQRADSSVWSLTLLPLFCLSFLYPLPKINLNTFSLHSYFLFCQTVYAQFPVNFLEYLQLFGQGEKLF